MSRKRVIACEVVAYYEESSFAFAVKELLKKGYSLRGPMLLRERAGNFTYYVQQMVKYETEHEKEKE